MAVPLLLLLLLAMFTGSGELRICSSAPLIPLPVLSLLSHFVCFTPGHLLLQIYCSCAPAACKCKLRPG
uniref:Uncharacterized protein n=2 Tax=Arundo donax TaxID=35708 RepID=A0A0A9DXV5_ARUDO